MMIINGVDISTLFETGTYEFLSYELTSPSFNRFVTTTDNDYKIVNRRESVGINTIVVQLVFYEEKETAYIMASRVASLLGDALVNFGGPITYRVQIATDGMYEGLTYNMYHYKLQLQVLEKMGELVTVTTTDDAVVLTNVGTYKTPIKIEVTPAAGGASMAMSGFGAHNISNPLTIQTITAGQKIVVDGEKCQLLEIISGVETNKFASSNLMTFPYIPAGTTTLLFTPSGSTKVITYRPRYI